MQITPFDCLLFLYFFTLHADQPCLRIGQFAFRLHNLVALILFCVFFAQNRLKRIQIERDLFISLLFIFLSIFLSFLFSSYKLRCSNYLALSTFVVLMNFILPYLLFYYYDSKKVISFYLSSFLVVGIYAFFQLIFSLLGLNDPFARQRIFENIVRPNALAFEPSYYALYMTPFIVMVNYHFLAARERPFFFMNRLTYPKILGMNFLYFVSTSTSTIFAFMIFCFCLFFISKMRWRLWKLNLLFGSCFCFIWVIAPYLIKMFFLKFFFLGFMTNASFFERWMGIINGWVMFKEHPFFGVGLGGFPQHVYEAFLRGDRRYLYYNYESELAEIKNPILCFEPMNVGTEALGSLGIFGILSLCTFIVIFILRAKEVIKIDRHFGYNLLFSFIVMLTVLQINQGLFRPYIWTHMAMVFALAEQKIKSHAAIFNTYVTHKHVI